MKYLFFLLILFNIAFYLWETQVSQVPPPPQARPEAAEERLALIQELPDQPPVGTPTPANQPPSPAAMPGNPPSEAAPTAAAQPPAPPSPVETPPPAAAPDPDKEAACQQLGPYASPKQAQAAWQTLGGKNQAKIVKKATNVETGYLILYPAAETLEAAQANRKMLVEKGVKDAWLIDRGENRYAISLAILADKARAEEAQARYRAQGIPAEIKPRLGSAERWWLEASNAADQATIKTLASRADAAAQGIALKLCD